MGAAVVAIYNVVKSVITHLTGMLVYLKNPSAAIILPKPLSRSLILQFRFVLLTQITNIGTGGTR